MPLLTPGRRYQNPFLPVKREPGKIYAMEALERLIKGPLFGCRMCGNCLLQETAFICPMACPKGLRNGPCGGSSEEGCYVDPTRPCIWFKIYERAEKMGREEPLLEVLPPLDWSKAGTETWGEVIEKVADIGVTRFITSQLSSDESRKTETWDAVFKTIRQPEWWQGDDTYHEPGYDEPASKLEAELKSGKFVVAAEIAPPTSTATGKLKRDIDHLKDYAVAINFTDAASATPKMSSMACCEFALEAGAEPVLQIAARDQTRTGLQGHVIGASGRGIRNILAISGDSAILGRTPTSRMDIMDIDSVQMLWILRRMRDEGKYLDGRTIKFPPKFFLGAAASPFASRPQYQAIREHKKINAGAQFFQTNVVFDADRFEDWLNALAKRNILDKVYILAGISPIRNLKIAYYMDQNVPGVSIPAPIIKRLEEAGDGIEQESIEITLEIIGKLRTLQGVSGIHLMPVGWETVVPEIVERIRTQAGAGGKNGHQSTELRKRVISKEASKRQQH